VRGEVLDKYSKRIASPFSDNQAPKSADFRSDISGLRALAVILVLLSHYEISGFSAGFVGVDVFFVISGYLITGLLAAEYERNSNIDNGLGWISIPAFYVRRARRILPAALFVLLVTVVVAYIALNVVAARQVAVDSMWAALFASNINFMHQATDYWAQGQSVSPVLHYWSLAVEEQFYLIWPLLFVAATSFHGFVVRGRLVSWVNRLLLAISLMTLVSFVWMVVSFRSEPNVAYFSSLTRAWELGVGAITVLSLRLMRGRNGGSPSIWAGVGLALIVVSMFVVSSANFGYTLILPVLGAALLLLAGSSHFSGGRQNIISRGLSIRPMVWIGAISYSLYLWHWPVLILGRQLGFLQSAPSIFLAIAITFVLAAAGYRFVELPFLRIKIPDQVSDSRVAGPIAILMCVLVMAGLTFVTNPKSLDAFTVNSEQTGTVVAALPVVDPGTSSGPEIPYSQQLEAWKTQIAIGAQLKQIPADMYPAFQNLSVYPQLPRNWQAPVSGKVAYIYGDSMAHVGASLLFDTLPLDVWSVKVRSDPGSNLSYCPVADKEELRRWRENDNSGTWQDCEKIQQDTLQEIAKDKPRLVVLIDTRINAYWNNSSAIVSPQNENFKAWKSIVSKIKKYAKTVVVVGIYPHLPEPFYNCVNHKFDIKNTCHGDLISISNVKVMQRNAVAQGGGIYIDSSDWLCQKDGCPPIIGAHIVYSDGYHWTADIGHQLAKLFEAELKSLNQWPV